MTERPMIDAAFEWLHDYDKTVYKGDVAYVVGYKYDDTVICLHTPGRSQYHVAMYEFDPHTLDEHFKRVGQLGLFESLSS